MRFLRNPEIKKLIGGYLLFTVLAAGASAFFYLYLSVCILAVSMVSGAWFLWFTKRRYDVLSELSAHLDRILHGEVGMDFVPDKEGELALLTSEIYKMTLRLREQAENLERDKAYLSGSLADISHQLRTPLTSLRLILPRLGREETELSDRREYACEACSLVSRMEWLIASLLKIARLESGTVAFKKETVRVAHVIGKALEPLEVMLDLNGIECDIDVEENASYRGDLLWSAEAVGNIIKNCGEHTPFGGRLHILGRENPLYTEIVIADTGEGIRPEDLPHLFDRFYKGKEEDGQNVGIGLALSRMIISGQNGRVTAKNRARGAEFNIRFYKGASMADGTRCSNAP